MELLEGSNASVKVQRGGVSGIMVGVPCPLRFCAPVGQAWGIEGRCACSGLVLAGAPMKAWNCVKSDLSVRRWPVALAMPKSMTFGTGTLSFTVTRIFDGLRSRSSCRTDFKGP